MESGSVGEGFHRAGHAAVSVSRSAVRVDATADTCHFMFSVPLIVVTFIALWAVNVWLLDKLRMPYTFVLNVKQSKIPCDPSDDQGLIVFATV